MNQNEEQLWRDLARDSFDGPRWQEVSRRLAQYGYLHVGAWIRSGAIFVRCRAHNVKGCHETIPLHQIPMPDLDDIIQDTVANAVTDLRRRGLCDKGWRPDGGASLTTYFAGACLHTFAGVYRAYCRSRVNDWRTLAAVTVDLKELVAQDVAEDVTGRDSAQQMLADIADARIRVCAYLNSEGYTHAETAHLLGDGTTPRQVEHMLARLRRRLRGSDHG